MRDLDNLPIGNMFLNTFISHGGESILFSREMDNSLGMYAHINGWDFNMIEVMLRKYGFTDIKKSKKMNLNFLRCKKKCHLLMVTIAIQ